MLNIASAEADITPPIGIDLSGFALRENPSTSVYDPLKIRWLALTDNSGKLVLLGSADVLSFSRENFKSIRRQIEATLGEGAAVWVALATTHTHSGPATVRLRHCGQMNRAYLEWMRKQVVDAAVAAARSPARGTNIFAGTALCPKNINRRQGESGPVDQSVQVVQFFSDDQHEPLATLLNYACHPVVLGHKSNGISADYPGYACAKIESELNAPCLFLNGACGDINPRDAHHAEATHAKEMGQAVANCAAKAVKSARRISADGIDWRNVQVKLPVRVPKSAADIDARLDMLQERFGLSRELFEKRLQRDRKALANGNYPRTITIELSLLGLGDQLAILFIPGELFTSIGLRAKALAAPRQLLISGFSNGSVGYLSDRKAYKEGGYEPYFANFFYDFPEFEPDLEDYLLAGIDRLLNRKTPGN